MSSCDLNIYNFRWLYTACKENFALLSILFGNNFLPAFHSMLPNRCKTSFAWSAWRQYKSGRYLRTHKQEGLPCRSDILETFKSFFCKVIAQSLKLTTLTTGNDVVTDSANIERGWKTSWPDKDLKTSDNVDIIFSLFCKRSLVREADLELKVFSKAEAWPWYRLGGWHWS